MGTQNKQWGRKYLEVTKDLDNYVVAGTVHARLLLCHQLQVWGDYQNHC